MALLKGNVSKIPEGAVILSEDDALKFQTNVLKNWKNKKDVWVFNNGAAILACATAATGIYINSHFRKSYKLMRYGQLSTYLPVCILPAIMSFASHVQFVLPDIVLQNECPLCVEFRASAIQASVGAVFPMILAPLAASSLALRFNTFDVPSLTKDPMKVLKLWKKQTTPVADLLFTIFVGHALLASVITFYEASSVETVNDKLMLIEYELERQNELM